MKIHSHPGLFWEAGLASVPLSQESREAPPAIRGESEHVEFSSVRFQLSIPSWS